MPRVVEGPQSPSTKRLSQSVKEQCGTPTMTMPLCAHRSAFSFTLALLSLRHVPPPKTATTTDSTQRLPNRPAPPRTCRPHHSLTGLSHHSLTGLSHHSLTGLSHHSLTDLSHHFYSQLSSPATLNNDLHTNNVNGLNESSCLTKLSATSVMTVERESVKPLVQHC